VNRGEARGAFFSIDSGDDPDESFPFSGDDVGGRRSQELYTKGIQ
jgi:hypothetical protein